MAKITYGTGLGDNGLLTDYYDATLQLQAGKSDSEKVIYKDTGEGNDKITITGEGFEWQEGSDVIGFGTIHGISFATKSGGTSYMTITGLDVEVGTFNEAYAQNQSIQDVVDVLLGGNDQITGSKLADIIGSGDGKDTVKAGDGADTLLGGAKADKLYGEKGNDYIWGDAGKDRMWGGPGSDTFQFQEGDGKDVIVDFDAKGGGKKQDYIALYEGETFTARAVNKGHDTLLDFGDGDTLTLLGVHKADFTKGGDVHWLDVL